jgi:outer membrane protein OmpA-like peptidoglycan-associated protein
MVNHPAQPPLPPDTGEAHPDEMASFEALRTLLLGSEQQQLAELRERVHNPELRARDVSGVVAEAIELRRGQDGEHALSEALAPSVEQVVKESVRKDPTVMADALFPVMGPAIRKSIAEAIRSMLQAFNEALEHSLSIRGIKWRIEALRTGRSFAEVVLLRSLVYRVEQIFLIHKKTGLLLQHVAAPEVAMQDPDMVSGMLSAIQDFVRDSFQAPQGEALNTLQVGELQVWVEQGPQAILAAVIRGNPPQALLVTMKEKLEEAHRRFGLALDRFEGNAAPFEAFRDELAQCLEARYREEGRAKPKPYFLVLAALLFGLLVVWKAVSVVEDRKWNRFVENLRQQPGIVVTSFAKEGGRYRILGLRDPLAIDPRALLEKSRLDLSRAEFRWNVFYALDDPLVLKRAQEILQPPQGVTLAFENGTLRASGESPRGWAKMMRARAPLIAGVKALDEANLEDADSLEHQKGAVESATVYFATGSAEVTAGQKARLVQASQAIQVVLQKAATIPENVVIEVVGHADSAGAEATNFFLSQQRASQVVRELARAGIRTRFLRARGAGTAEPVQTGNTDSDRQANRSVTFRVVVAQSTEERRGGLDRCFRRKSACSVPSPSARRVSCAGSWRASSRTPTSPRSA